VWVPQGHHSSLLPVFTSVTHLLAKLFLQLVVVVEFGVSSLWRHRLHTLRCLQLDVWSFAIVHVVYKSVNTSRTISYRLSSRSTRHAITRPAAQQQHPADWQSRVLSHVHEITTGLTQRNGFSRLQFSDADVVTALSCELWHWIDWKNDRYGLWNRNWHYNFAQTCLSDHVTHQMYECEISQDRFKWGGQIDDHR